MSKKDQIFWGIWAAVVLGAGAVYYFVVIGMETDNQELLKKKVQLASRLMPLGKTHGEAFKADNQSFDAKLKGLYPLTTHLKRIPTNSLVTARVKADANLKKARKEFVRAFTDPKTGRNFVVKPSDFNPRPPDAVSDPTMALFRQWVQAQQARTDEAFLKAGKGIQVTLREAKLLDPANKNVRWMDDGRVNGYIERAADRKRVLYRLLLREKVLMAIARTRAPVRRRKPRVDGKGETPILEPRKVGRIVSFRFVEQGRGRRKGRALPYSPNRMELTVSCHLAVVPALLRELESIGSRVVPGAGSLEQQRPFAFWADELRIRRPKNWPETGGGSSEINSERLAEYGRYLEWPITAVISGTVPEFNQALDPEPSAKSSKKKKK